MKLLLIASIALSLAACVTPKYTLISGAETVVALSNHHENTISCKVITNLVTGKTNHTNNATRKMRNDTYIAGGTHYKVRDITHTNSKGQAIGYAFDVYSCHVTSQLVEVLPTGVK